jgi:hypothetical protein
MNTIKTSDIVDPNVQQGFTGKSLKFLQDATKEQLKGIALSLSIPLSSMTFDNTKAYILHGLDPYGTNQYNEGWIYYQGEIYYCAGKSTTTPFVNFQSLTIAITNDAVADPAPFSDGSTKYVHNVVRMNLIDSLPGAGILTLGGDTIYNSYAIFNAIQDQINQAITGAFTEEAWHVVGAGGQPAFQNSWANTNPSSLNSLSFKKVRNKLLLRGNIIGGSTNTVCVTLPGGYRPLKGNIISIADHSQVLTATPAIEVYANGDIEVFFTGSSTDLSLDGITIPLD